MEEVLNTSHLRLIPDENLKNRILDLRSTYSSITVLKEHVYHDRMSYLYNDLTMSNIELNGLDIYESGGSFSTGKYALVFRKDAENFMNDRYFKSFFNLLELNIRYVMPRLEKARKECEGLIKEMRSQLN
jgi:hypothetical protein